MSYDVYMFMKLYDKDGEFFRETTEFHFNYTSNMSSFWDAYIMIERWDYENFEDYEGSGLEEDKLSGLEALVGLTGEEALPYLKDFFEKIYKDIYKNDCNGSIYCSEDKDGLNDLRRKYDSKNGWGCMVSAMIMTAKLMTACAEYPKAKILLT